MLKAYFKNASEETSAEGITVNIATSKCSFMQCRTCRKYGHMGEECVEAKQLSPNDATVQERLFTAAENCQWLQCEVCKWSCAEMLNDWSVPEQNKVWIEQPSR